MKKRKTVNNRKKIFFLWIGIFIFSFFLTFNLLNSNITNEEFIRMLLAQNNPNIEYEYNKSNIFIEKRRFYNENYSRKRLWWNVT